MKQRSKSFTQKYSIDLAKNIFEYARKIIKLYFNLNPYDKNLLEYFLLLKEKQMQFPYCDNLIHHFLSQETRLNYEFL